MVNQSCMSKGLFKQGQTSQRQLHRCKAQPSIGKDSLKLHPWSALTCRQLPKLSILPQQFLLILWPPRERSFVNLSSSRDFQRLELLTSWVLKGAPSGMEVFPFGKYCCMTGNGPDQQHLLWVAYAPSFSQLSFGCWLHHASVACSGLSSDLRIMFYHPWAPGFFPTHFRNRELIYSLLRYLGLFPNSKTVFSLISEVF